MKGADGTSVVRSLDGCSVVTPAMLMRDRLDVVFDVLLNNPHTLAQPMEASTIGG
ncbi:hypothetical protein ACWEQC_44455 [Streptomyces shenzhenensis]